MLALKSEHAHLEVCDWYSNLTMPDSLSLISVGCIQWYETFLLYVG